LTAQYTNARNTSRTKNLESRVSLPINALWPEWFLPRRSFGQSESQRFSPETLSREGEQAPFGHGKQIMNSRNGEQNQKRRSQLSITTAVFSTSLPPMRPTHASQLARTTAIASAAFVFNRRYGRGDLAMSVGGSILS
jgi:hypothetical protein